eukprot:1889264-Rhodomonas_salina.3
MVPNGYDARVLGYGLLLGALSLAPRLSTGSTYAAFSTGYGVGGLQYLTRALCVCVCARARACVRACMRACAVCST